MAGLSGMDVPEYLEDIKALEEVLSPTLTLPGRWSPGGERGGEGTGFLPFALPVGATFTFLGFLWFGETYRL